MAAPKKKPPAKKGGKPNPFAKKEEGKAPAGKPAAKKKPMPKKK